MDDLDSSEDDDYVPDKKQNEKAEKELIKQNGGEYKNDDEAKTGIELLKQKKREKETDDLWDLMQEEDDIYKKKRE